MGFTQFCVVLVCVECSDHTYYRQSEPESSIGKYSKDYANLPERYIIRKTTNLLYKSEKGEPATPPEVRLDT